jgi:hypothetical protein
LRSSIPGTLARSKFQVCGRVWYNMDPFAIVEPRELSRGPNSKFEAVWGILLSIRILVD